MPERAPGLTPVRLAIDGVDDGLVLLLATRAQLAKLAGRLKARAGVAGRDGAESSSSSSSVCGRPRWPVGRWSWS